MIMRTIALALAIAGGIAASQVPEFAQQYRQRLGGAVDELARVLDSFDQDAATSGDGPRRRPRHHGQEHRAAGACPGVTMAKAIIRYDRLLKQQIAFQNSVPFARLTVFFQDFDRPLVESTLRDYEPAVPTTSEGFVFAVIGFFAIYGVLGFIGLLFGGRRRRHNHHHAPEQAV